jgi:hypothetical protein
MQPWRRDSPPSSCRFGTKKREDGCNQMFALAIGILVAVQGFAPAADRSLRSPDPMAMLLRVLVICLTFSQCRAYGRERPLRSTPPMSIPSSEACIPGPAVRGTQENVEGATVSLASMLVLPKTKREYEHAERALARNKLEEAEKDLNSALMIYPKSAVAWCLMGTVHEEKFQLDKASLDYSQALVAEPQMLAPYLGLARIAFREKRWQEVIQFTDQLVRVNPIAFPVAYLYNAAANFNLRTLMTAEKSARRFESLDTEHERPQVYLLLGDILAAERDYAGAPVVCGTCSGQRAGNSITGYLFP